MPKPTKQRNKQTKASGHMKMLPRYEAKKRSKGRSDRQRRKNFHKGNTKISNDYVQVYSKKKENDRGKNKNEMIA